MTGGGCTRGKKAGVDSEEVRGGKNIICRKGERLNRGGGNRSFRKMFQALDKHCKEERGGGGRSSIRKLQFRSGIEKKGKKVLILRSEERGEGG